MDIVRSRLVQLLHRLSVSDEVGAELLHHHNPLLHVEGKIHPFRVPRPTSYVLEPQNSDVNATRRPSIRHKLPCTYFVRSFMVHGSLISVVPDFIAVFVVSVERSEEVSFVSPSARAETL